MGLSKSKEDAVDVTPIRANIAKHVSILDLDEGSIHINESGQYFFLPAPHLDRYVKIGYIILLL